MKNNKPLDGIKVIEISTIITASLSAMMLADQGAEVIKIEQTGFGDPLRYLGTQKGGVSAIFANVNRGKSSLELDLKKDTDLNSAKKLICEADVLINNFRPGVMEALGLSKAECKKINKNLIYVAITGFGKEGPFSSSPAYDHVVQAMSGATAIQSDGDKPQYMKTLLCDKITAYTATQSICSALYKREKTGEASSIDLSMLDSSMFFLWPDGMMNHTLLDNDVEILAPLTAAYNMYECKDGSISIAAMLDKHWHGIFKAVDKPELIDDQRFSSAAERSKNFIELLELVSLFKNYTVEEMFERLSDNDVPCSTNLSLEQAITNQQVEDNYLVKEKITETQGKLRMIRYPAIFDEEKFINDKPAPKLGEDNKKLLK
ncbi:MAG: CaiB/BaiF CoA transferase family protein [Gammaproteobacteria bacterium]|jgi:crotonobetainyl-CoA:carnitine CoA-transferase CaiB-like acyl-CoA transferase|tara:strand:- start:355 stop:1479 length:1125 start_codon:yes stop_codon:yes gene_type:complete